MPKEIELKGHEVGYECTYVSADLRTGRQHAFGRGLGRRFAQVKIERIDTSGLLKGFADSACSSGVTNRPADRNMLNISTDLDSVMYTNRQMKLKVKYRLQLSFFLLVTNSFTPSLSKHIVHTI